MGNKTTSKSVLKHTKINSEIVDCIEKMQSLKLFTKDILTEEQEYSLLKDTKSDNSKVSNKAVDKLSRFFFKYSFVQAKLKLILKIYYQKPTLVFLQLLKTSN